MLELITTDIFEAEGQLRHIFKSGQHEIDIQVTKNGITIEIHKDDEIVAECAVDFD